MKYFIGCLILVILMVAEYFLCIKLKSPLFGGIIPLLLIIATVCVFAMGFVQFTWRNFFPFSILIIIFLGDWERGREQYKKLMNMEIEKMKAKDIQ